MYSIAIIGTGALGKRHLESVLKTNLPCEIYAVDNDKNSLESVTAFSGNKVVCGQDTDILPKKLDVVIIATSSASRKYVFEQAVSHSEIKYIIFEKVLFQKIEDYYAVEKLLRIKKIKSWVNCVRREWDSYISLKKIIDRSSYFTCNVSGGNWGLACNCIHLLDLIQFLSGSRNCKLDDINLTPVIVESKRKGYKEVFGAVTGSCGKCQAFSIACFKGSSLPMQIELSGDNFKAVIMEDTKKMLFMQAENNWKMEEKEFSTVYQSQLTQKVVENIVLNGNCKLPEYEEAMGLHLKYIKPLIVFFEEQGLEKGLCPIT